MGPIKVVEGGDFRPSYLVDRPRGKRTAELRHAIEITIPRLQERAERHGWNRFDDFEHPFGRDFKGSAGVRCAVEVSVCSKYQRRYRITAVRISREVVEHSQAPRGCDLEDIAVAVAATLLGGSVEIAVDAEHQPPEGIWKTIPRVRMPPVEVIP